MALLAGQKPCLLDGLAVEQPTRIKVTFAWISQSARHLNFGGLLPWAERVIA